MREIGGRGEGAEIGGSQVVRGGKKIVRFGWRVVEGGGKRRNFLVEG